MKEIKTIVVNRSAYADNDEEAEFGNDVEDDF